ncbi:2-aminoethylphosphonate--pyruvate transaminase [Shewanella psychrophila]|uniref:2-aminoethylphosphonate--pyruvate transaminase n=1 Tax=Shewanella psychrophila TaxID=225848 RepID=A0A1S6HUL0_9GAMM|nr:2-aminoethylphosphonate--pyruvate transaminase [Shewanella psychrophila]AQS39235.1 2-aminoethylphosphonate--pyruvate transaminase [Shewanella psychrophila]
MQQNEAYLLLTPGPLTTSNRVKATMLKDWCTWDDEYNAGVVQDIRQRLVAIATKEKHQHHYTCVLMQGSGTASVESVIGTVLGNEEKLLVINNGAYGARMTEIADYLAIDNTSLNYIETQMPTTVELEQVLSSDPDITHVALVHCETTTGMLNPVEALAKVIKKHNKVLILDAMSSFGGLALDVAELGVDFLISSANKCIQGVPGFGFIIAKTHQLAACEGRARSLSLDLYAQWRCMEDNNGKWRFTSPTHTVRAFQQALNELDEEGGVPARAKRYRENQSLLISGMERLGFKPLLPTGQQSPIISSFHSPTHPGYCFSDFYERLKHQGFVIYPGKVSNADCFRIGNIGHIFIEDIERLLEAIKVSMPEQANA